MFGEGTSALDIFQIGKKETSTLVSISLIKFHISDCVVICSGLDFTKSDMAKWIDKRVKSYNDLQLQAKILDLIDVNPLNPIS